MLHFAHTARATVLAAIGVCALASGFSISTAEGAQVAKAKPKPAAAAPGAPPSEADQKLKDAAVVRQSYESGIKSYSSGKFQPAVDELSSALRGGGLASPEMAKALYVRGLAYKKLSKPGLAISDLTSALWLKNGLGEADQKSAMAERAEAYRLAGLGDGNTGADNVSIADPNPTPAGAKVAPPPAAAIAAVPAPPAVKPKAAAPMVVAAGPGEITRQSPDSESAKDAANARRLASAPVETSGFQAAAAGSLITQPAPTATQVASVETGAAAVAPTPSIAPPSPAPVLSAAPIEGTPSSEPAGSKSGVSGFFSNLFGGAGSPPSPAPAAKPVTTASTTPSSAISALSDPTSVGSAKKPAPSAPPVAMPAGKYKLHIAAVRSRAEAEALAQKLASQQGAALKSRTPVVDEAVIGSMGTFYRVRVGSFANAEEPRGVCNTLRSGGFDCLVVTN
jgi:SPOR domain